MYYCWWRFILHIIYCMTDQTHTNHVFLFVIYCYNLQMMIFIGQKQVSFLESGSVLKLMKYQEELSGEKQPCIYMPRFFFGAQDHPKQDLVTYAVPSKIDARNMVTQRFLFREPRKYSYSLFCCWWRVVSEEFPNIYPSLFHSNVVTSWTDGYS